MHSPVPFWCAASRSPLASWLGGEARLEPARAFTTLQWIGCRSGRQNAEPDELRTELVADVYRLRGCIFEVQRNFRHGVVGPAAHAGGGELLVPLCGRA